MKVIFTIFKLFRIYKPLNFFAIVSVLLTVLAAIFFVPVFIDYVHTGLVLKFPTLIVCGFVIIAALLSLFSGLILSSIVQKNRQDFEMELNKIHMDFNSRKNNE